MVLGKIFSSIEIISSKFSVDVIVVIFRLSSSDGFTESTRDKVCTQYSSRDCSRFWIFLDIINRYLIWIFLDFFDYLMIEWNRLLFRRYLFFWLYNYSISWMICSNMNNNWLE